MTRRTGKFYFKNEKEVMKRFGLNPTIGSGSGFLEKEDGQNERIICQLKSTDANSYRIKQDDMKKLEYNANVVKKIPVFMVQFLKDDEIFLILRPENIEDIYNYLTLPKSSSEVKFEPHNIIELNDNNEDKTNKRKIIKSGNKDKINKFLNDEKEKRDAKFKADRRKNEQTRKR